MKAKKKISCERHDFFFKIQKIKNNLSLHELNIKWRCSVKINMVTNRDDFNLNYLNLYQWTIWQRGMNIFTISFKSDLMWENETKIPHCRNNSKIEKNIERGKYMIAHFPDLVQAF